MNTIGPVVLFSVFGIPIYDTVVSTWVMMVIVILAAYLIGRRRPAYLELLFDFLNDQISDVMGRPAGKILPFVGALAIFILSANLIGMVPGLSTPTGDINTPIALALVVFLSVHVFGVVEKGFIGYIKEFASPIFLLPIELLSQLTRTISLTLRLFGNMMSSDFLVVVIFSILPLVVPLPLIGLHIFDGILQAYIFTALSTVYIASAVLANEPVEKNKKQKPVPKQERKVEPE
jgi:F-type H+-transporting ATPase subunit a